MIDTAESPYNPYESLGFYPYPDSAYSDYELEKQHCHIQQALDRKHSANRSVETSRNTPFKTFHPFGRLPSELRRLIVIEALKNEETVKINFISALQDLHQTHTLAVALPESLLPDDFTILYYAHKTFSFTCSAALKTFSAEYERNLRVKKVEIELMRPDRDGADWPFVIMDNLLGVESVTAITRVPLGTHDLQGLISGWYCFKGAFRESLRGKRFELRLFDREREVEIGIWKSWIKRNSKAVLNQSDLYRYLKTVQKERGILSF